MAATQPNGLANTQSAMPVVEALGNPLGYAQYATFSGVQKLTVPSGATAAIISVSGNPVRLRDDGTNPTASIGFPLPITTTNPWFYYGAAGLAAIAFIPTTGSSTLDVLFYG